MTETIDYMQGGSGTKKFYLGGLHVRKSLMGNIGQKSKEFLKSPSKLQGKSKSYGLYLRTPTRPMTSIRGNQRIMEILHQITTVKIPKRVLTTRIQCHNLSMICVIIIVPCKTGRHGKLPEGLHLDLLLILFLRYVVYLMDFLHLVISMKNQSVVVLNLNSILCRMLSWRHILVVYEGT